jgi:hypothetical protein
MVSFSFFTFITFMLIWFAGVFTNTLIRDKRDENKIEVYQVIFAIFLNVFSVYYIISLVGMTLEFCK